MKKIIGAALAASLLAGTAFADISFSYKNSNYFTTNSGNLVYDNAKHTDCLGVEISNDLAGVVVDFDIESGALSEDEYYGWMKFGALKVTAGKWTSRFVNRVKKDGGELDGADFEMYKPGVINPYYTTVGVDSDNLTKGKLASVVDYTVDMGGAKILLKGAITQPWFTETVYDSSSFDSRYYVGDTTTAKTRKNTWSIKSGFAFEAAYIMDQIAANVAIRNPQSGSYSVAAFGTYGDDQITLTAGVTAGVMSKVGSAGGTAGNGGIQLTSNTPAAMTNMTIGEASNSGKEMEYAVDFRLRFQLTDKLSFTTMHNISSWVGVDANALTTASGTQAHKNFTGLWDMVNLTYQADEKVKALITLNSYIKDLSADKNMFTKVVLTPALAIQATEHASVTTGLHCEWTDAGDNEEGFTAKVPVIFKFAL